MTVAAPSALPVSYLEDGTTRSFAAPFRYLDPTHLTVTRVESGVETALAYGTAWSATTGDTDAGGTVTIAATVSGATLVIGRATPRAQTTQYETNDRFPAKTHEAALDRDMLIAQEIEATGLDTRARALLAPAGEALGALPVAADRAGGYLTFGPDGDPTIASGAGADSALRSDLAATDGYTLIGNGFTGSSSKTADQNRDALNAVVNLRTRAELIAGSYSVSAISASATPHSHASGQQPHVILPTSWRGIDGKGAELVLASGRGIWLVNFATTGYPFSEGMISGAITAGDRAITMVTGDGAKFTAGQWVKWQLGSFPYDKPEPLSWGFAKVLSVAGDVVTLGHPIPIDFDPASVAAQSYTMATGETSYNKKLIVIGDAVPSGLVISDLLITGDTGTTAEEGWVFNDCQDVTILRNRFSNLGVGIIAQYVTNMLVEGCAFEDSNNFQASVGHGINIAETRGFVSRNNRFKGMLTAIAAEAGAEFASYSDTFENTGDPADGSSYGSDVTVLTCVGLAKGTVYDLTVTGYGGYVLATTTNGQAGYEGSLDFKGRLTLVNSAHPKSIPLNLLDCILDYRCGSVVRFYDFTRPVRWLRRFYLKKGMTSVQIKGPYGVWKRLRATASPGLTFGTGNLLSAFLVGYSGAGGSDYSGSLVAGQPVQLNGGFQTGGTDGGAGWTGTQAQVQIAISTAADDSLNTGGYYVDIEGEIVPDKLAAGAAWSSTVDLRLSGPGGGLIEALFPSFDLPSVPANSYINQAFTVPGITANDVVEGIQVNGGAGTLVIGEVVAGANTITVQVNNTTASPIDLSARDWVFRWRKSVLGA